MLKEYRKHEQERRAQGIPALALNAEQVADLVELIKDPPVGEEDFILDIFSNKVPAGVDQAAYVKAAFLTDVANSKVSTPLITCESATRLLGTMLGGYNVQPLISLLNNEEVGDTAVEALSNTLLIFDSFHDVFELSKTNERAKKVISSWAEAEWFLNKPAVPEHITAMVLKVDGEINTDDLSPGPEAWSRPDIPLHALTILKNTDLVSNFSTKQLSTSNFDNTFDGHNANTHLYGNSSLIFSAVIKASSAKYYDSTGNYNATQHILAGDRIAKKVTLDTTGVTLTQSVKTVTLSSGLSEIILVPL